MLASVEGSWVVTSGVMSRVEILITHIGGGLMGSKRGLQSPTPLLWARCCNCHAPVGFLAGYEIKMFLKRGFSSFRVDVREDFLSPLRV